MMAMFTMRIKEICEMYSDKSASVSDKIKNAIPHIFDDSWKFVDEKTKTELCNKILRYYYMREICFETLDRWILAINTEMGLISDKYAMLYSVNVAIRDHGILNNTDLTETTTQTGNGSTLNKSKSENASGNESETKDTQGATVSSTGSSTGSGDTDAWQTAQDTPQGALTNIENETYLSSAVHNRGANSTTSNSSSSSTTEGSNTSKSSSTSKSSNTGETSTTVSTENSTIRQLKGNSGSAYIDLYEKAVSSIISIDQEIIRCLSPLFFGLYE